MAGEPNNHVNLGRATAVQSAVRSAVNPAIKTGARTQVSPVVVGAGQPSTNLKLIVTAFAAFSVLNLIFTVLLFINLPEPVVEKESVTPAQLKEQIAGLQKTLDEQRAILKENTELQERSQAIVDALQGKVELLHHEKAIGESHHELRKPGTTPNPEGFTDPNLVAPADVKKN